MPLAFATLLSLPTLLDTLFGAHNALAIFRFFFEGEGRFHVTWSEAFSVMASRAAAPMLGLVASSRHATHDADVWDFANLATARDGEFMAYAGVRKGANLGAVLAVTEDGKTVPVATGFPGSGITGIEVGSDEAIYASVFDGDRVVRITRCAANCDGNNTLDLFDFLCFVNKFNASDSYADFDGNANYDLFDFLGFVNAFNAGC